MAPSTQQKIGKRPKKEPVTRIESLQETWQVMKPFVHFSVKALKVVAYALIFIVKQIPKPEEHQPKSKKDKVIKI
jgi:hypothetical protein